MSARRQSRVALAGLLCATFSASAAVYRCGSSYGDVPCTNAARLEEEDRRTDDDRAAAQEVARREAALAARMLADRERAEAQLLAARPQWVFRPTAAASAPKAGKKRVIRMRPQEDADGNFVAYVPAKRTTTKP